MLHVTFHAVTVEGLLALIGKFSSEIKGAPALSNADVSITLYDMPANGGQAGPQTASEVLAPEQPRRGPGRPKKAEPKQTDIEDVAPAAGNSAPAQADKAPAEAAAPTYDDMVKALTDLNKAHGMATVRGVLLSFGCQKVNEPKPEQYADVIAAAQAKLAA